VRVGLISHDLAQRDGRGLRRYLAGLARCLSGSGEVQLVLFSRESPLDEFDDIVADRVVWRGRREILWEQVDLPRRAKAMRIDVLHAPSNRGLPWFTHCPRVLTRHDEIERKAPPDFPSSWRSDFRRRYADWLSIRAASRIVTVSEASRRDIEEEWHLPSGRVVNLGEGIDERFFEQVPESEKKEILKRIGVEPPFALYVGGFERRKRLDVLIDAFEGLGRSNWKLVLVGSARGLDPRLASRLAEEPLKAQVSLLGRVAERELAALLQSCGCFVFTSQAEGFGLPVVEAMASGAPVVCSNAGSLPEVAGDAAILHESGNAGDCFSALSRVTASADLRAELSGRGRRRAEAYRWRVVGPRYVEMYRKLAGGGSQG
jgi:glycosyltransferase involved in cell wall biosynthesis